MAGRPPLPIGTAGKFSEPKEVAPGVLEVMCGFRDYDGVTRRVRARGATGAKATAALREKVRDRKRRASGTDELTIESTLAVLIDRWVETLQPKRRGDSGDRDKLADDTVDGYEKICANIIKPGLGGVRLRELNTQRCDSWLASLATRRRETRSVLAQVCGLGVRWNLLEYNPIRETESPPRGKSDKRTLLPGEVTLLADRAVAWRDAPMPRGGSRRGSDIVEVLTLFMATGERIGEVLALLWEDVEHLDDYTRPATVTITGTVDKRGKRQPLPKSEHGYRRLLLPNYGREALIAQRARGYPFDVVFPSRAGTVRWPSNTRRTWREIRGDDYAWVVPKTFRKTAATAIEREFGAEAAAAQLGHSSPDITRKHYIDRAHEAPDNTAALDAFNPFPSHKRPPGGHLRAVGEK